MASRKLAVALVLLCASGCSSTHDVDDAAAPLDGEAFDAGVMLDARPFDAGRDAITPDAAAPDAGRDAALRDTGPRADADLVIHSRCASPPSTQMLSLTYGGACRLDDTGQLWCWGNDEWGQVRPGAPTWVEPHEIAYEGLSDVVTVEDSGLHRCVIHTDGGVSCWGSNRNGECGLATSTTSMTRPTRVPGIGAADRLAVTAGATCARMAADGRWLCWGGLGYFADAFGLRGATTPTAPMELPGLLGATAVSIGSGNAVALFDDGHVEAVAVPASRFAHAYPLAGIDDGVDVVAFDSFVCAVRHNGEVWCAGETTVADDPPPHRVPGIDDAVAFAHHSGTNFETCVVRADGSLWCWTMARDPAPWPVPAATDVATAAMGAHLCAVTCAGDVLCNGTGERGENGDDTERVTPYEVPEITDAIAIDGDCALRADGTVACWDIAPQVTYDPPCPPAPHVIEPLLGVDHVVQLDDGAALRDDGSFRCLGGAALSAPAPIVDAACSRTSSAAFGATGDGRLFQWTRSASTGAYVPSLVTTAAPVAELASDAFRTRDGRVFDLVCMDFLGLVCGAGPAWPGVTDAEAIWTSAPRYVDFSTVTKTDCLRHTSGRVDCRFVGESRTTLPALLGIATPVGSELVHVPVLDGAADIFAYDTMLCAVDAAGATQCWGNPFLGRLGTRDVSVTHTTPVSAGAIDLAADRAMCALGTNGHVTCWGFTVLGWSSGALCPPPLDRAVHVP